MRLPPSLPEGGGVLAPGFLRSLYRRVQGILRSLLLITEEPGFSEPLHVKSSVKRTIFFTPVIITYMKKNLDITKPRYREQILPVPSTEALRKIDTKRIH